VTTSKLDHAYGRRGGRIVPWTDQTARFHVGQLVRVIDRDVNRADHDAVITAIVSATRVTVSYGKVVNLTLNVSKIEPVLPRWRPGDGHTSHDAALSFTPEKLSDGRRQVLTALVNAGAAGLTDFELEIRTGRKQTSFGKRRGELRDAGLVEWSGETRPSDTGTLSKVWRATDLGIKVFREQITGAA